VQGTVARALNMGKSNRTEKGNESDSSKLEIFTQEGKEIMRILLELDFDIFAYQGYFGRSIYVLLRAPIWRLRILADTLEWSMLADGEVVRSLMESSPSEPTFVQKDNDNDIAQKGCRLYEPYNHIYFPFNKAMPHKLYSRPEGDIHPFTEDVILKLTLILIESLPQIQNQTNQRGSKLQRIDLKGLQVGGHIQSVFPLHNRRLLDKLSTETLRLDVMPWRKPSLLLRIYFGEKISLRFVFLAHYAWYLRTPAIVGTIIWIIQLGSGKVDPIPYFPLVLIMAGLISIWAVILLETWLRKEKATALECGMANFEEKEVDSPNYSNNVISYWEKRRLARDEEDKLKSAKDDKPNHPNDVNLEMENHGYNDVHGKILGLEDGLAHDPLTGKKITYFPHKESVRRRNTSTLIIFSCILLAIGAVASTYILRRALYPSFGTNANYLASILSAVQVIFGNILYENLATNLTEWENHRTATEFEDALITKLFSFQFVNSYSSFFYIAFIAPYTVSPAGSPEGSLGACGAENCLSPLSINLGVIFASTAAKSIVTQMISTIFTARSSHSVAVQAQGELSRPEVENLRLPYDGLKENLQSYINVCIQFGYTSMFVTALTVSPLLALIVLFIDMKGELWSLIQLKRRPPARGAEDIGNVYYVFVIVADVAIVTNAGIATFTHNPPYHLSIAGRVWFFFLFALISFGISRCIAYYIDDVTAKIDVQLKRTEKWKEVIFNDLTNQEEEDENDDIAWKLMDPWSTANTVESTGPKVVTLQKYPTEVAHRSSLVGY
jgi:hypothetical protein